MTEARDDVVRLADGRAVAYLESGDPAGPPVLYFHGNPGCRLDTRRDNNQVAEAGVRVIALDRPGVGGSDPSPGRRLLDWPADVAEVADALGLDRFAVAGYSAGGPYALACGRKLPDRVTLVGLLAAMGPLDGPKGVAAMGRPVYWRLARRAPGVMAAVYGLLGRLARRSASRAAKGMEGGSSATEREMLRRPEVAELFARSMAESTREGGRGLVDDMRVLLAPWGFRPEDVRAPARLWWADDDTFVPEATAKEYERRLPACRVTHVRGGGHFFVSDHFDEILRALTARSA